MTKSNEIRLDEKGNLDDIVIDEVHLEDMNGKCWWLAVYRGKKRTAFWIESKSKITVRLQDNELGTKVVPWEDK